MRAVRHRDTEAQRHRGTEAQAQTTDTDTGTKFERFGEASVGGFIDMARRDTRPCSRVDSPKDSSMSAALSASIQPLDSAAR